MTPHRTLSRRRERASAGGRSQGQDVAGELLRRVRADVGFDQRRGG